jgi:hypothetical protein
VARILLAILKEQIMKRIKLNRWNNKLGRYPLPLIAVLTPMIYSSGHADKQVSADSSTSQSPVKEKLDKPRQSSRLKFRDGPICMCSNGFSEKEIQQQSKIRTLK